MNKEKLWPDAFTAVHDHLSVSVKNKHRLIYKQFKLGPFKTMAEYRPTRRSFELRFIFLVKKTGDPYAESTYKDESLLQPLWIYWTRIRRGLC